MITLWETEDIATEFEAVSSKRVHQIAVHLGLHDSEWHAFCLQSGHYAYTLEAVKLIRRELRSRGYERRLFISVRNHRQSEPPGFFDDRDDREYFGTIVTDGKVDNP